MSYTKTQGKPLNLNEKHYTTAVNWSLLKFKWVFMIMQISWLIRLQLGTPSMMKGWSITLQLSLRFTHQRILYYGN